MTFFTSDEPQQTIVKEVVYKGVGLHTGNMCRLAFRPAPEDTGVVFVRADLASRPVLPATFRIVSSVVRGTTLSLGGEKDHQVRVHTVEHVLSALSGLGIDNLVVEVNANEPPVADGSALPFIKTLQSAGLQKQNKPRRYFQPEACEYKAGEAFYRVEPAEELVLETTIDFNHRLIGRQTYEYHHNTENYIRDVAPARTFCFDYEVEALKKQGLAMGGSLDNAVVVGMDRIHNKEKSLRFPDEFARHKTLDLLGDLSLLGVPLRAKITAARVGHGHNINLVKQLAAQWSANHFHIDLEDDKTWTKS
ncbi:MAG: UDP-3-O-[3-hydroxymyristoyl] N-acetylglucosamine deacetylase [Elusimicrobia bacterium]|nr:UDP-3-O-[3-hydroxymyristoyl] N-acetylglucosamine deacetylase [Elusimicrobiota bacterium]